MSFYIKVNTLFLILIVCNGKKKHEIVFISFQNAGKTHLKLVNLSAIWHGLFQVWHSLLVFLLGSTCGLTTSLTLQQTTLISLKTDFLSDMWSALMTSFVNLYLWVLLCLRGLCKKSRIKL